MNKTLRFASIFLLSILIVTLLSGCRLFKRAEKVEELQQEREEFKEEVKEEVTSEASAKIDEYLNELDGIFDETSENEFSELEVME